MARCAWNRLGRWAVVGLLALETLGLAGLTVGAQLIAPLPPAPPTVAGPVGLDQALTTKDYIVLVSGLYALDGDKDRARARLNQLGLENSPAAVADLAELFVKAGREKSLLTDLATLARDLGVNRPGLAAYAAKPKPVRPVSVSTPTSAPATPTPKPLPTVDWDIRLSAKLEPPIKVAPAEVKAGQSYWRLIRAWWQDPEEGHDAHHVYVNVLNKDGIAMAQPIVIENGGKTVVLPEGKPDSEYLINYPMSGTLGSYTCYVAGDWPSDRIVGLGLGFAKGGKDHTCFILLFQETVAP